MKLAFFLFLLSTFSLVASEIWPGVEFAEVRAYVWAQPKDQEDYRALILDDMSLVPGVINPEGAVLTPAEINRLRAAVTGQHPDYTRAMCYLPHNAFVFYDADRKPVAFYEVCFTCLRHRARPREDTVGNIDFPALAAIFAAHKLSFGGYTELESFNKNFESSIVRKPSPSESQKP